VLEFEFKVDRLVAVNVVDYVCTPYRLAQNSTSAVRNRNVPLA